MTILYDFSLSNKNNQGLNIKIIGRKIYHFKNIDSTNLYAKKLVKKRIQEGTVVIADTQISGRGRKKRIWSSPHGGLWFSIILYPNIHSENGMIITMIASVSVAQAVKEITGLKSIIKWPNDVQIKRKKLCGILTEFESELNIIKNAVVGIGINVNNKIDENIKDIAISLKKVKGSEISCEKLLFSILRNFDYNYQQFLTKKYENIRKIWFSFSKIIGKKVEVNENKKTTIGIISDVDESGCLILDTSNGMVRILSGDLRYL